MTQCAVATALSGIPVKFRLRDGRRTRVTTRTNPRLAPRRGQSPARINVECRRPASGRSGGDPTDAQPRGPTARSVGCESRLGAHPRAGRRGSRPAPPHGPPRPHCYHSLSNVRRQMIHLLGLRVSRRNSQRRARADGSSIVTITARRIGSDGRRRVASCGDCDTTE